MLAKPAPWLYWFVALIFPLDEANQLEHPPLVSHEEFYNTTLDHTELMPDFYSWQYSQSQTTP